MTLKNWVIAAVLSLSGAALVWNFWPASSRTLRIAQWGQERYLIYLPLYVAIDQGLFRKRGIEVEIAFAGNDDQTFAAVAAGRAELGVGDPVFAAIAKERGFEARVVASLVGRVAIWGVAKSAAIPLMKRPEDLTGLRVGTFPEPSTNYSLMKGLADQLGPERAPTIVQAPIGSQLGLLESGAADVAMELEPATSLAEDQGYRVVFSSPKMHGPFAFTGVTTTQAVLKEKSDLIAAFVGALSESLRLCHEKPAVAVESAVKNFPSISEATVARAVNRMLAEETWPRSADVDKEAWERALNLRVRIGDLKSVESGESTLVQLKSQ